MTSAKFRDFQDPSFLGAKIHSSSLTKCQTTVAYEVLSTPTSDVTLGSCDVLWGRD